MPKSLDQLEPAGVPAPKPPLTTVVLGNFALLLTYMTFFSLPSEIPNPEDSIGALAGDVFCLILQVIVNVIVGIILVSFKKHQHIGNAFLLGSLVTAVIGFGTCYAFNRAIL
jgi:hypothetical protein